MLRAIETLTICYQQWAEDLRKFQENFLCEMEDWSAEDLCLNDCFELIEKAMNSPLMAKEFGGLWYLELFDWNWAAR